MPPKYKSSIKKYTKELSSKKPESSKFLVIVESPSKCSKIEQFLGHEFQVIASKGHICELNGLKSFDVKNNYEPTFQICKDKKDHVSWMKSIIDQYPKQNIILATDDDREGSGIAYNIACVFGLDINTTQRIVFHEITKPAISHAIQNPAKIDQDLVKAQHARQILDLIVGFKISPLLWKYIYHAKSNSLSAGRCQTPALRLVYDNWSMKENSKESQDIGYKTTAQFFNQNIRFDLDYEYTTKQEIEEFLGKSPTFEHRLSIGEKKTSKKSSPKPYNTSALLQAASSSLHLSPKQTMQYAQRLYQEGYITYMRTENTKYSKEFVASAQKYIATEYGDKYVESDEILGNRVINNDVNKPHEAVRITNILVKEVSTSVKEVETLVKEDETKDPKLNALYKMIWRNTVESCMPDAQYNVYKVAITAPQEHQYQHILEIPVFLGWKKVVEKSPDADAESALLMHIQLLIKQNKPIPYNQIDSVVVIHKHHQHYTEAGLINKMEDLGIGRPSTFATLVDTIIERGYVKIADVPGIEHECTEYKLNKILGQGTEQGLSKTIIKRQFGQEKNKLIIQPTGILCIEFLMQHFSPLFSYDYTKNMEEDLDKIAESTEVAKTWWKICERVNQEIKELTKPVENVAKQLYKLDETHSLIFHQYGVSIKHILGNGDTEYLPVKKSIQIDLDKLKQGKYTLDELLEFKKANLGKYEDQEMMLKMGQYGPYVEWGENKKSIQDIGIPLDQITIENIISFLKKEEETSQETDKSENKHILRVINPDISIRRGKFGNYIYYKTATMKAPKFIPLKKFKSNSLTCDIQEIVALVQS